MRKVYVRHLRVFDLNGEVIFTGPCSAVDLVDGILYTMDRKDVQRMWVVANIRQWDIWDQIDIKGAKS